MNSFYEHTIFPFHDISNRCDLSENINNQYNFKYYKYEQDHNQELTINSTDNTFSFNFKKNNFRSHIKSTIIICSKDNSNVLAYTLSKLSNFGILDEHDILLVDDRSSTSDIFDLSLKYSLSYLRIDNNLNIFNYSIINNIAASYANAFDKELLIFYNNDMWPPNKHAFQNIVNSHIKYNSNITGCRLLYPTKEEYANLGKPKHLLDNHLDELYDTVQHGGIFFIPRESFVFKNTNKPAQIWVPLHLYRFYEKHHPMACEDSSCHAVTGAMHIISTKDFILLDGLNICLATAFQDIDLCIKAVSKNMIIKYIGSEYMYHAESITNAKENLTSKPEHIYDNIVWDILWTHPMTYLLGYNYKNKIYLN